MATSIWSGPVSEEMLGAFAELTDTYYSGEAANEGVIVRWRHLEGPLAPSTAVELVSGNEHVGRMWIQRQAWRVRSSRIIAANPIDFLIREDHRKLPAFLSLFKATMKKSHEIADFVVHSSNPLTDDLYRKLMKFKPVTELDGAVLPIRPFAVAKTGGVVDAKIIGRMADVLVAGCWRLLSLIARAGGVALSAAPAPDEQERIVDLFHSEQEVCTERGALYRAWRFAGAGSVSYEQQWITRRGKTVGYLVFSDRDVRGSKGRFVIDFVYPQQPGRLALISLWLQVAGSAARSGREAVFFFYNKSNPQLAAIGGFPLVTVPRSRLPQQIPVFVRLSEHLPAELDQPVAWASGYFVMSDFDMF